MARLQPRADLDLLSGLARVSEPFEYEQRLLLQVTMYEEFAV